MKQKLTMLLCLTVFCLSAQNRVRELNFGIGQIKYNHSGVMPSGISGAHYTLDYWQKSRFKSNENLSFGYFTELVFSNLSSWRASNYNALRTDLDVGIFWLKNLSAESRNFNFHAGGGLLFDTNVYYSYFIRGTANNGFGQWFLSPFVYLLGDYSLDKFNFQFRFSMPVLLFGFRSGTLFQPTFFENLTHVLTPNTFTFFTQRFHPKLDIACSYPIFSNDKTEGRLQLRYSMEQLVCNRFPAERKAINGVQLGMIWIMK